MTNTAKYPFLRRSLIVLAFLGLVGLFFALNLFLYIPRQQQLYNKKVFRILKEIAQGFTSTIDGKATTHIKNISKDKAVDVMSVPSGNVNNEQLRQSLMVSFKRLETTKDNSSLFSRIYQFKKDTLFVSFAKSGKAGAPPEPDTLLIDQVLYPNVQQLHNDLFHLLMLVKRTEQAPDDRGRRMTADTVLYKRGVLSSSYRFNGDSLFKNGQFGLFSTVNNVDIEGAGYKAFSMPFQAGSSELVLIGFLPQRTYHSETTRYSKPALLWIGAFLVLIMLSLPVIKILMSGRKERITINETRMLIVVFVTMPFLVVLSAGAAMMYKYASAVYGKTLTGMHHAVQQQFRNEVDTALQQLKKYDSLTMGFGIDSALYHNKPLPSFAPDASRNAKDQIYYPGIYKNLDDIYWTDSTGRQIAKWFFLQDTPTYLNVAERGFYKRMRDQKAFKWERIKETNAVFVVPTIFWASGAYGIDKDSGQIDKSLFLGADPTRLQSGVPFRWNHEKVSETFFVEPTISWATGEYGINIVTTSNASFYKDKETKALLIGMASRMYSVCHPVVPKGYNFCIVNKKGLILFHSETERSLHENLLEESNYNAELAAALNRKEEAWINDMQLFDRDVKMLVAPVAGMPDFYIASYYNKRAQNLFVFHCAAFTFLCASGMLLALLLFHLVKSLTLRTGQGHDIFRYETEWMRPSEEKKVFYSQILKQQFFIASMLVPGYLVCWLAGWQPGNFLLQACIFLPFLITINYFLVKKRLDYKAAGNHAAAQHTWKKQRTKLLLFYAIAMTILLLIVWQLLHAAIKPAPADWVMLMIVAAVPLLACCNPPLPRQVTGRLKGNFFGHYLALLLSCIALITVVPAIGFMAYAMQQEKIIKIKSDQIAAAKQIEKRRLQLNENFRKTKLHKNESAYMHKRKLSQAQGMYLPNQELHDTTLTTPLAVKDSSALVENAAFYKAATRFLFLPRDHADFFENNKYYYWRHSPGSEGAQGIQLLYANQTDHLTAGSFYLSANRNTGDGVFQPFKDLSTWLLILGVLLFFLFHYLMLRSITRKVFLLGYITEKSLAQQNKNWPDAFYKDLRFSSEEMELYATNSPFLNQLAITRIESGIKKEIEDNTSLLHLQHKLTPAYNRLWDSLTDEQKFVLYDFATDGFTNYRNMDVVYPLFLKGLIIRRTDGHLEIMSYSFRSYLLGKAASEEIIGLQQKNASDSPWKSTKNMLYALFFAIMIFLFATQQDVSNKIIAIVSGLATIVPLLIRLFDRNVPGNAAPKS